MAGVKKYLVTIAIPAFNAQDFIKEAIESVIAQKLPSFEIVVVNDGSTDNTSFVCHKLINKYKNTLITYFEHRKNLGPCAAHNQCVNLSKGEYIYNLDADNILSKNLLIKLLKKAKEIFNKTGKHYMISPEYAQFFVDRNLSFLGLKFPIKRRVMLNKLYFKNLDYNHIMTRPRTPATGGNYLFYKSIFKKTGGYLKDGGCFDNWGFGIACYISGYRFITVPNTFYYHRLHDNSNWVRLTRQGLEKKYLYKLLSHFKKYYSEETLNKLHPSNSNYPKDPYIVINLKEKNPLK